MSEAIRLASLLAEHPTGNRPRTHALIALMLLNAARLPARTDSDGNILRLKEQDRLTWDHTMVARGMFPFSSKSADGDELSTYHLQAAIAACHCVATNYESTDWRKILSLYDQLLELDNSPIVALIAPLRWRMFMGRQPVLTRLKRLRTANSCVRPVLYTVLGEFEKQLNHFQAAIDNFRKALELTS